MGYFAQGQEDLEPDRTVLDHMLMVRRLSPEEARRHLARFLFQGDEVLAPVGRLSGGERARVSLARLILMQPNLLLLDEPTNHLDIAARTALEAALSEYDGTLIVVSHDRYFLDTVCDSLWVVEGGKVRPFDGTYSEFAAQRQSEQASEAAGGSGNQARRPDDGTGGARGDGRPGAGPCRRPGGRTASTRPEPGAWRPRSPRSKRTSPAGKRKSSAGRQRWRIPGCTPTASAPGKPCKPTA